jgi:hypothetical protein
MHGRSKPRVFRGGAGIIPEHLDGGAVKGASDAVVAALEAAEAVRGKDAKAASRVSLALHASRTLDPSPFLAKDPDLAKVARKALEAAGRKDLALRVALWAADGGVAKPEGTGPVSAFLKARAWAAAGGPRAELGWIRDVPRDAPLRAMVAERLLLRAEGGGEHGSVLAAASLEAELADAVAFPAFPRILRAVAVARSAEVVARTQESVGVGAHGGAWGDALADGERLAGALALESMRAGGRPLAECAKEVASHLSAKNAEVDGVLVACLAGTVARTGDSATAAALAEAAATALAGAKSGQRMALATALFVRSALPGGATFDPMAKARRQEFTPAELAGGAAAASRALRSAGPALRALRLFDPEDHLAFVSKDAAAQLLTHIVREGADAASATSDLPALSEVLAIVRRVGLRPSWEIFLRALVADAAAHAAAWDKSQAAWDLAMEAARGRAVSPFERAKLESRAACEFVRAAAVPLNAGPWADLVFAPPARQAAAE